MTDSEQKNSLSWADLFSFFFMPVVTEVFFGLNFRQSSFFSYLLDQKTITLKQKSNL
tara:strand:+ start:458 stop:628 length:171 start_codon:yes stop_codon:yes gene_type:complete